MKKGFTLAEVLITLTIIGVVAAVTLPSLQNNVNKQALEKQTLKFYNTLQEAHDRYLANNHLDTINLGFLNDSTVRKYFNVIANSEDATSAGYFANEYTNVNGDQTLTISGIVDTAASRYVYKLADGTVFTMVGSGGNGSDITAFVDVNGEKGPNVTGYDMWTMHIDVNPEEQVDGISDRGCESSESNATCQEIFNSCISGESAYGCFGHFLRNGFKFDY